MLLIPAWILASVAFSPIFAQSITESSSASSQSPIGDAPTGTDLTYNSNTSPSPISTSYSYVSVTSGVTGNSSSTITANGTTTGNSSSSATATVLSGTARNTVLNGTATLNSTATTSSSPRPVNTQPCNRHVEFCTRKYSNITYVAAHNSPFVKRNNVASNQALDVTTQLNDGIRMLQFQAHNLNGTINLCHSSCDLLNAGTLEAYLATVTQWLDANRYEVITILLGNSDRLAPTAYEAPVANSGLLNYLYIPPTVPMARDGWPTLGEMILTNKRVVFMMDYEADQAKVPWLLDEFSYMWETPFSPTDRAFPCTVQRPPNQDRNISDQRLNMANHNLNIAINALGLSILVPAYNLLNETNAESGYGSAGAAVSNCTADWGRAPNFLLVDYYNIGSPINGSVLAVAAAANNVSYNVNSCCGTAGTNAGWRLSISSWLVQCVPAVLIVLFVI